MPNIVEELLHLRSLCLETRLFRGESYVLSLAEHV